VKQLNIGVVGAGIVGLAVAYHLIKQGAQVTVFDRDPQGDKASFGNAGAIAVTEVMPASTPANLWRVLGWMLDPLGPLAVRPLHALRLLPWLTRFARAGTAAEVERISRALARLNARVYEDLVPMLADIGLVGDLHRNGALSVYESDHGYRRDNAERVRQRELGVIMQEMSGEEARQMEPALGPLVQRAVLFPQWSYVSDPKRVVDALRDWVLRSGAVIRTGEVLNITSGDKGSVLVQTTDHAHATDRVVVAAGAWSALLARRIGDRAVLESERGYNMTLPNSGITLTRELIFAERKFVATQLDCGLRIGGAAEFGGLNASPNFKRSAALIELARRYLPQLRTEGGVSWAGHRPTTPDSLPVIGRSHTNEQVFYAFGHGHLGLTQAATTGRLLSEIVLSKPPSIDVTPYSIGRFNRDERGHVG
jgi:D-amino-acid dehydrogenase